MALSCEMFFFSILLVWIELNLHWGGFKPFVSIAPALKNENRVFKWHLCNFRKLLVLHSKHTILSSLMIYYYGQVLTYAHGMKIQITDRINEVRELHLNQFEVIEFTFFNQRK